MTAESSVPPRLVVMGPSGAGKSVVGAALAEALGIPFLDADDLHPAANVAKMSAGTPLDDADRMPWLDAVGRRLREAEHGAAIACSALARRYRERILRQCPDARFVELRVATGELGRRMQARQHFMPPTLLASQLNTWEPLHPEEPGISVENSGPLEDVVAEIRWGLGRR